MVLAVQTHTKLELCKNFIIICPMKKELELVNFISVLCDGLTDNSVTQ